MFVLTLNYALGVSTVAWNRMGYLDLDAEVMKS